MTLPIMARLTLLAQVLAVLVIASIVGSSLAGAPPRPHPMVIGVLAAVVGGVAIWTDLVPTVRGTLRAREGNAAVPRSVRDVVGGNIIGAREDVLMWVDAQVPRDARIHLDCGNPSQCGNGVNEWTTWRLSPRFFTDRPEQAEWVLFYGIDPASASYAPTLRIRTFAPNFGLGQRRR